MPLQGLEHVLVLTDDLEATRDFYCNVLGFDAGDRPPLPFPGYWLYLAGSACVHIADRAAYEAHAETIGLGHVLGQIDHLAFAADDHEALVARLSAGDIDVVANDVPAAGIRQLFLHDPNGVRIELNCP